MPTALKNPGNPYFPNNSLKKTPPSSAGKPDTHVPLPAPTDTTCLLRPTDIAVLTQAVHALPPAHQHQLMSALYRLDASPRKSKPAPVPVPAPDSKVFIPSVVGPVSSTGSVSGSGVRGGVLGLISGSQVRHDTTYPVVASDPRGKFPLVPRTSRDLEMTVAAGGTPSAPQLRQLRIDSDISKPGITGVRPGTPGELSVAVTGESTNRGKTAVVRKTTTSPSVVHLHLLTSWSNWVDVKGTDIGLTEVQFFDKAGRLLALSPQNLLMLGGVPDPAGVVDVARLLNGKTNTTSADHMWKTTLPYGISTGVILEFRIPSDFTLDHMRVWNYNRANCELTGVQNAALSISHVEVWRGVIRKAPGRQATDYSFIIPLHTETKSEKEPQINVMAKNTSCDVEAPLARGARGLDERFTNVSSRLPWDDSPIVSEQEVDGDGIDGSGNSGSGSAIPNSNTPIALVAKAPIPQHINSTVSVQQRRVFSADIAPSPTVSQPEWLTAAPKKSLVLLESATVIENPDPLGLHVPRPLSARVRGARNAAGNVFPGLQGEELGRASELVVGAVQNPRRAGM